MAKKIIKVADMNIVKTNRLLKSSGIKAETEVLIKSVGGQCQTCTRQTLLKKNKTNKTQYEESENKTMNQTTRLYLLVQS